MFLVNRPAIPTPYHYAPDYLALNSVHMNRVAGDYPIARTLDSTTTQMPQDWHSSPLRLRVAFRSKITEPNSNRLAVFRMIELDCVSV